MSTEQNKLIKNKHNFIVLNFFLLNFFDTFACDLEYAEKPNLLQVTVVDKLN